MAFNWSTFRTRALTAIVFVVVMLGGLLWNDWSFFLLFTFIHFGCWWEYLQLLEKIRQTTFHPYTKQGFMLMGYGMMVYFSATELVLGGYQLRTNLSFIVSLAGIGMLAAGIFSQQKIDLKSFGAAAIGFVYISITWGAIIVLKGVEGSSAFRSSSLLYACYLPLFIIVCMWINDTMAYIVGSLIGKTPFSPISPKKTWEGTIGGMILAALIVGYLGYSLDTANVFNKSLTWWIVLAAVAAIAGTYGDLLESKLKRMAGVKDSGTIMPGHGGFLDRFDSLLLATPVTFIYIFLSHL